jgi:two-component system OmpR family response regulator
MAIRVILIEHHQLLARPLKRGLEEEGYSVVVAQEGERDDPEVPGTDHDVIILDAGRAGDNGLSLLQNWRRNGLRTPVLVLSSPGRPGLEVRGSDIGPVDFLSKPFVLNELFSRLRALSGGSWETGCGSGLPS